MIGACAVSGLGSRRGGGEFNEARRATSGRGDREDPDAQVTGWCADPTWREGEKQTSYTSGYPAV
jgi:hypothetical protein